MIIITFIQKHDTYGSVKSIVLYIVVKTKIIYQIIINYSKTNDIIRTENTMNMIYDAVGT